MAKIARMNRFPEADKYKAYTLLIPPSVFDRFRIDPWTGKNREGEQAVHIDAPCGGCEISVRASLSPRDRDPVFHTEICESRDLVQLRWDFIMINDPDSPRFDTDVTPEGGNRWLNWRRRNHKEEKRAQAFGLAPGQVRRGLRLTGEIIRCLEKFAKAAGFKSIFLEALFYHNAIQYERHGFRYFEGEEAMRHIHEGFKPGGPLYRRLDGSFFRRPCLADTVRGRSWLIHSGILDEVWEQGFDTWTPPRMYKMVGKDFQVRTAPDLPF
ncbi:MAG: hypothetical protein R6V10_03510 [bacterium]